MPTRFTKQDRIATERLIYHQWHLSLEKMDVAALLDHETPALWHTIIEDWDVEEPREKITLYLDRSVARGFKAMGKGYHQRINRILQSWLQMKILDAFRKEEMLRKFGGEVDPRMDKIISEDVWADEEVKALFRDRGKR